MNLILVGICGFLILQDVTDFYPEQIGRFGWFGFDNLSNGLINGIIVCLGLISIGIQLNPKRIHIKDRKGKLLKALNLIYGIFVKILGSFFLITSLYIDLLNNFEFNNRGQIIFSLVMYCVDFYLIYVGFLIIQQTLDERYTETHKLSSENDILDKI